MNQAQAATEPKKPKAVHRVDPELEDWSTDHLLGLDEVPIVGIDYFPHASHGSSESFAS